MNGSTDCAGILGQTATKRRTAYGLSLSLVVSMGVGLSASAQTVVQNNYFSGSIEMDGDISGFIDFDTGAPKAGVCVMNDPRGLTGRANDPRLMLQLASSHPSGFNQRRILSAYNPNLNGGTVFVGIDLPGGSGAGSPTGRLLGDPHSLPGNPNPNYVDA